MTDYAELEKRLREAGAGAPKAAQASGFFTISTQAPIAALCTEAADAVAALTRELEEAKAQFLPRDIDIERGAARLRQLVYGPNNRINCTDLALAAWQVFFDGTWERDEINNTVRFVPTRLSTAQAPAVTGQGEK